MTFPLSQQTGSRLQAAKWLEMLRIRALSASLVLQFDLTATSQESGCCVCVCVGGRCQAGSCAPVLILIALAVGPCEQGLGGGAAFQGQVVQVLG